MSPCGRGHHCQLSTNCRIDVRRLLQRTRREAEADAHTAAAGRGGTRMLPLRSSWCSIQAAGPPPPRAPAAALEHTPGVGEMTFSGPAHVFLCTVFLVQYIHVLSCIYATISHDYSHCEKFGYTPYLSIPNLHLMKYHFWVINKTKFYQRDNIPSIL